MENSAKPKKSFKTSLKEGNLGQKYFTDILDSLSIKWESSNDIHYDIIIINPIVITVEIKNDLFSAKSGNIAIEFWNSKQNKPSGINATTATYWVHVLSQNEIWVIKTLDLKKICLTLKPLRTIKSGGNNNSNMYLYKKENILKKPFYMLTKNNFFELIK